MEFCIINAYAPNNGGDLIPCRILAAKNGPNREMCQGTMARHETGAVRDGVFYQSKYPNDWMISAIPDWMFDSIFDPHSGEEILRLTATVNNSDELHRIRDNLGRVTFTTDGNSVYVDGEKFCDLNQ